MRTRLKRCKIKRPANLSLNPKMCYSYNYFVKAHRTEIKFKEKDSDIIDFSKKN